MKQEFTNADREAKQLFKLGPGARFGWVYDDGRLIWERAKAGEYDKVDYIDMDDEATQGVMLKQLLDKATELGIKPDIGVSGWNYSGTGCGRLTFTISFSVETRRPHHEIETPTDEQARACSGKLGRALVTAMRCLLGRKEPK